MTTTTLEDLTPKFLAPILPKLLGKLVTYTDGDFMIRGILTEYHVGYSPALLDTLGQGVASTTDQYVVIGTAIIHFSDTAALHIEGTPLHEDDNIVVYTNQSGQIVVDVDDGYYEGATLYLTPQQAAWLVHQLLQQTTEATEHS